VIPVDDGLREGTVPLGQGPHGLRDLVLDEAPHLEHGRAELGELLFVPAVGVQRHQPNRPVM
jgi:hypothetical protein